MPTPLKRSEVARLRILLLAGPPLRSLPEIARWFGAMQAQDLASGKWSFGVRLPHGTELRDLEATRRSKP